MKFVSMSQQNSVNRPVKRCIDQQLEIFPLQPGTQPVRPEGDTQHSQPARVGLQRQTCSRSTDRSQSVEELGQEIDRTANLSKDPVALSHWKVATKAWQSVQRGRAKRNGAATVFQQGTTSAISLATADLATADLATAEQDSDQLNPIEQLLAVSGFLMTVVLLISAL